MSRAAHTFKGWLAEATQNFPENSTPTSKVRSKMEKFRRGLRLKMSRGLKIESFANWKVLKNGHF